MEVLRSVGMVVEAVELKQNVRKSQYILQELLNHSPGTTFSSAQLDALGYLGFQLAKFIQELLMSLD